MKKLPGLFIIVGILLAVLIGACQKYKDKPAATDPRLTNPYCNDPNAVNYNWGFPGKPDSTTCIYPNQLFVGKYVYYDSIYQADYTFSYRLIDTLLIFSTSHTSLKMTGFCPAGDTMALTAGVTYVATLDTTEVKGQMLCRAQDTVSGTITKNLTDTVAEVHINFTVYADTATTYHIGTALKL